MNEKILSFQDVIIRQSDVDCLEPCQWINDIIIEFYLQYLSTHIPQGRKDILYIPPSTTYLMLHGGLEVAKSVSDSLHLKEYATLFFALNDNTNPEALCGGTHWSSLVVDVQTLQCTHYDSSIGSNADVAQRFVRVLSEIFEKPTRVDHAKDCPQQDNGYDCGLFCIYIASSLFPYHKVSRDVRLFLLDSTCPGGNGELMHLSQTEGMRKGLIQLILDLSAASTSSTIT